MNKRSGNLDELQEQKLLRIERNTAWFAFWGLLAAILVQTIMGIGQKNLFHTIAGEWIVFMCLAIYMGVSCIKNGIWDRHLQPNPKTNIVVSLAAGFVCAIVYFLATYFRYHKLLGSIATGIFMFTIVFALSFAALSVSAILYKKRVAKLESESDETSDTQNH